MMKKYVFLLLMGVLTALVSCGENEIQVLSFTSDAYVRGMYVEGKVAYAPVLLAVLNQEDATKKISVVDSKKNKYLLIDYWNNKKTLRWVPVKENFSKDFQNEETYTFSFAEKLEKQKEQVKQVRLSEVPKPFKIESTVYDKEKKSLKISWTNANATTYLVQITSELDEYPFFQSSSLTLSDAEATILTTELTPKTFKWLSSDAPRMGAKYLLAIHAFNFTNPEDITGEFVATKEIIWGK